jgi:hypothetical protein
VISLPEDEPIPVAWMIEFCYKGTYDTSVYEKANNGVCLDDPDYVNFPLGPAKVFALADRYMIRGSAQAAIDCFKEHVESGYIHWDFLGSIATCQHCEERVELRDGIDAPRA